MFRRYLELAVEHPTLAEPDEHPRIIDAKEFGRYEWFVGLLLRACEELLEYRTHLPTGRAAEWYRTVESQLILHRKYFINDAWYNDVGRQIYRRELVALIERVKSGP
jgi:hypothetical protein